jgi:hypothetical protein
VLCVFWNISTLEGNYEVGVSLGRGVGESGSETSHMVAESNNPNQGTELCRANVEICSVSDRQVNSDSNNNIVMSASQFREFISTVIKEFDDWTASMRTEITKLAEIVATISCYIKDSTQSTVLHHPRESFEKCRHMQHSSRKTTLHNKVANNTITKLLTY